MTTFRENTAQAAPARKLTLAEILEIFAGGQLPFKFSAYDGSTAGPDDAELGLDLLTPRGTTYLATAPGDLGLARAYVSGDLEPYGVHPGILRVAQGAGREDGLQAAAGARARQHRPVDRVRAPSPSSRRRRRRCRWRRISKGLRHSRTRDAEAIHHHYDVSNTFYQWVLGPSMTYTCACYPHPDATLEEAQENKHRLVFEKLRLKPGDRLLDVGCGWGGMVRYAARHGVQAIGVTLSKKQAAWGQNKIADEGLADLAEVRHGDYRDVPQSGFDAVSSIGLTEHIGVANYPAYFRFLKVAHRRAAAQPLHHPPEQPDRAVGGWIHRPLRLPGRRADRLRPHHHRGPGCRFGGGARRELAPPLRADAARLVPQPRRPLGRCSRRGRAADRQGGPYMAGSRLGFETNVVQLHPRWRSSSTPTEATPVFRCGRGGRPRASYQFSPQMLAKAMDPPFVARAGAVLRQRPVDPGPTGGSAAAGAAARATADSAISAALQHHAAVRRRSGRFVEDEILWDAS